MHQQRLDTGVRDLDDLAFPERVQRHPELVVRAEPDRLAVMKLDDHVGPLLFGRDGLERPIVEHVAVLVHLDERRALVVVRPAEHLDHVLAVHVVGPSHERGFGAERDGHRVERRVERPERR